MSFPFSVKEENHGKIKPSGQKEILLFKLVRDCMSFAILFPIICFNFTQL